MVIQELLDPPEAKAARMSQGARRSPAEELLEQGDGLIEMDRRWVILRVNTAQERITGKPRSETLGRVFWEVWPEAVETKAWRAFHRCIEERVRVEIEDCCHYFEPLDAWFAITAHPTSTGGIAVFFRDITPLKLAEREQRRLASIVESIDDAILSTTLEGTIETWNFGAERLFGYAADEVVGRPITLLLPRDRMDEEDRILAELRAGRRVHHLETKRVRKDGGVVDASVSVSPLRDKEGEIVGASRIVRDMTERRRAEEALRASEEKFRSVFEQAAIGMGRVRFSDARWIDVNDAVCHMLGRSRAKMLSTPWPEITHPDDIEIDLVPFRRMASGTLDSYTVEKRFVHGDGHHVWARLTLSLVRDANGQPDYEIAIIEEITDRKHAEEALRLSQSRLEAERVRLQTVMETIPVGLFTTDARGALTLMNDEAKRIWAGEAPLHAVMDYSRYKGFQTDTGERLSAEDWPCAQALRGKRTEGLVLDIERFDGSRGTILVSSAPIHDPSGRIVGAVAANQDISELRAAQARLQEADRHKDEFLGMLSHELRNPLAPIRSALAILDRAEPNGPQARRARDVIHRQVGHLTRLVDDLLDVTRIARGKIALRRAVLDLGALVRRTAEDYRAVMAHRKLDLTIEVPEDAVFVNGDEVRLAQVLGNLLSNAAKFTPTSGRVSLAVQTRDGRAIMRVRDTGPGIAKEVLPTIFEPFTQAKQTLARSEGGLGLALVKGLVELHGGDVAVSSADHGAEFVITLPLAATRSASSGEGPARLRANGASPRRVLVIDDSTDAAESLAEFISMLGHTVDVAYDAVGGLEKAATHPPDIVLCDIGLPGMTGYEFARRFRTSAANRWARLVAVSGYARTEDVEKAMSAGFDAHLAKPPDPADIEKLCSAEP